MRHDVVEQPCFLGKKMLNLDKSINTFRHFETLRFSFFLMSGILLILQENWCLVSLLFALCEKSSLSARW